MIQVYTGKGKGKTTAAVGLAVRALGRKLRVCLVQFMKTSGSGEILLLSEFPGIDIYRFGNESMVDPSSPAPEDFQEAEKAWRKSQQVLSSKRYDLVILDEINLAAGWGLITVEKQLELMEDLPAGVELIMTGRQAAMEVLKKADLVTEMLEIKHYHQNGIEARKGIEY